MSSIRERVATGLAILAQRLSREPRYTESSRVSTSPRTLAGVPVTPDTSLRSATVWACDRYLSQTVAVLPWHAMRDGSNGAEIKTSHPVDWLIYKRPNPDWSSFQFREQLMSWALRWGNGYGEIERDGNGRPIAVWPIHPERVQVCRTEAGALYYEVSNGAGGAVEIDPVEMFHIRGRGEGNPVGVSVMHYAAQSIGWAQAAQLFGASFFGNGAVPSVVVKNKKALTENGLKQQRAEFAQLYRGPRNANKTAHVDNDTDVEVLTQNAEQTQLIESHQFLVEEICRWFGVPPHKVMHLLRATFSNIEHQAIEVVVDSVTPWVRRFEDEADFKFFGAQNRNGFYTKMNMRALLRGDFKSQNEGFEIARRNAVINADEWREYLDMNKMPAGKGGDKYVMQAHNTTLERIGEELAVPAPSSAPAPEETAAQARLERMAAREMADA